MITVPGEKVCFRVDARYKDQRYPWSDLGVDHATHEDAKKVYDSKIMHYGTDSDSEFRVIMVTTITQLEVIDYD